MTTLSLNISGMTCSHCVAAVKKALDGVQGVAVEQVAIGSAVVEYDETRTSPAQITLAVEDEGYAVTSSA